MPIERIPSDFAGFSEIVVVRGAGTWIEIAETRKRVVPGGVAAETSAIFDQMERLLETVGATLADVVKLNVFMTNLSDYSEFSAIRSERFPHDPPASAAVGVADLLLGAKIEIDGVAVRLEA